MVKYTKKSRGLTPKAEDRTWHKNYRPKTGAKTSQRINKPTTSSNKTALSDLVYGLNPVLEYLETGTPALKLVLASGSKPDSKLHQVIRLANNSNIPIFELPRSGIDNLTRNGVHQGVVLYVKQYQYFNLDDIIHDQKPIIVLDHITDSHNLGAIVRSAAAFSANIIIPKARSAKVNSTVWKTSAGNLLKVKITQVANISRTITTLQNQSYFVVGLDGQATYSIEDKIVKHNKLLTFVAGNEGSGIASLTSQKCDILAKIPVAVESLNVAEAVTIALYTLQSLKCL